MNQPHPTISAVIPTFNREGTIGRAIDSVLAQEFAPSEIIVIDDGSTDRTAQILAEYGKRIRCVHQANAGVAAARNRGVKLAAADWIAFLDSDDFWLPHHLKQLASAISETRARAALYFSDLYTPKSNSGTRRWELSGLTIKDAYELREDAADWAFMRIQPMMLQGSAIRRQAYLDCGGLPEQMRVREDTLLFYKLVLLHPACAVSGCGLRQTDDAAERLTRQLDATTVKYSLDTITLYQQILAMPKPIRPKHRKRLVDALSAAYFGAGRAFYRQKRYRLALRYLLWSAVTSSRACAECSSQSLAGLVVRQKPTTQAALLVNL